MAGYDAASISYNCGIFSVNNGSSAVKFDTRTNGLSANSAGGGVSTPPATSGKRGLTYNGTNFTAVQSGGLVTTNAGNPNPSPLTQLQLGGLDGSNSFNLSGHLRFITYYPTALPSSTLQGLTR